MSHRIYNLKKKVIARLSGSRPGLGRDKAGPSEGQVGSTSFPKPQGQIKAGGGKDNTHDEESEGACAAPVDVTVSDGHSNNVGSSINPDRTQGKIGQGTVGRDQSDQKSTAVATAKILLFAVRDTADVFPPLKSVAGGLCSIWENLEVPYLFLKNHLSHHPYGLFSGYKLTSKQSICWHRGSGHWLKYSVPQFLRVIPGRNQEEIH